MVSIEDFAVPQGWQHIAWKPDLPEEKIFVDEGTVLIGIADEEKTKCHLAWLDSEGRRWSIQGLPFQPAEGQLAGEVDVISEATRESYRRVVDIGIDMTDEKTVITGRLRALKHGDGPVGTFTAEAHPRPIRRERIAV